jgi:hypothetical protein
VFRLVIEIMNIDKKLLTEDAVRASGIKTQHERMENGELRFRLTADDGSGYIRTVASETGGWQNSHYHEAVLETYISQQGWMALAELVDHEVLWHFLLPGDVYTTRPKISHNVYLPAHAVIHTVKHGTVAGGVDWHADSLLDSLTKPVLEEDIRRRMSDMGKKI